MMSGGAPLNSSVDEQKNVGRGTEDILPPGLPTSSHWSGPSGHPLIIMTSPCQSIPRKLTIGISNRNIYTVYDSNRTRKITNH